MGKKNNPNRDNVLGKEQRAKDNQRLSCSVLDCRKSRYGYSKFCMQHKNHIASTGALEQPYIKGLKTSLKPYVEALERQIDSEVVIKNATITTALKGCQQILNQPYTINHISLEQSLSEPLAFSRGGLPSRVTDAFKRFNGNANKLLAVSVSVFLFQKEQPNVLLTGAPLFFHCGKLLYSFTKYEKAVSAKGRTYYRQRTLTKNQYINLGIRFYSKFSLAINFFLKQYEANVKLGDSPLRVKKTPLERLIEERQERMDFVYQQQKVNSSITNAMVAAEVAAIDERFKQLIEEEKSTANG